mgnify:CR=1 FL=1
MAYEAYLDKEKKNILKAKDAAINHINQVFYCKTPGCKTLMTLVDAANPEHAYFRKIPSSPDHLSILCSADGVFEPTKYEENKFDFEDLADKIMSEITDKRIRRSGGIEVHGGGGKKSISTVKQIYLMCRKYAEYNGIKTNKILADERNFEENKNSISGKKIVQCTYYRKVHDEFSFIMNYPSFPYKNGKHIRIDFEDRDLFWEFYNKVKPSNHKELILILGDWKTGKIGDEYIARCTIYRKMQYSFLKS